MTFPGPRRAGLLLHPTSLPGGHGIGDIGPAARDFIDFLATASQSWWQMLPLGPPGRANSPYSASSLSAGNPLLISLDDLSDLGLLGVRDLRPTADLGETAVAYAAVRRFKLARLRRAFAAWDGHDSSPGFEQFVAETPWLHDYSQFHALARVHRSTEWGRWGKLVASDWPHIVAEARFLEFVQWVFARQWDRLRNHARANQVSLLGDVPIYPAYESADVWSWRELFDLDRFGRPRNVAGVPPDYFSARGQLWRNPLYRWSAHRGSQFEWWNARLRTDLGRFDALRLDHFIGFVRFFAVPAAARDARHGVYRDGPGAALFTAATRALGRLPLIAEDLGVVTPAVRALREEFDLPGMRVLQFEVGSESEPEPIEENSVVYTGTHDNLPSRAWYRGLTPAVQGRVRERLSTAGTEMHWALLALASRSPARLAIVPVQDVLGLGAEATMNRPGVPRGNWRWRLNAGALSDQITARLRDLTIACDRAGRP